MTTRQAHELWRGQTDAGQQIQSWSTIYKQGLSSPKGTRLGYAIVGLKKLLHLDGYDAGMNLSSTTCGDKFARSVKTAQRAFGLAVDGEVGPKTGKALAKIQIAKQQTKLDIPSDWLCKDLGWESSYDPGAIFVNYAPDGVTVTSVDRGVAQFNTKADPTITDAQAYDPTYSIPALAQKIKQSAQGFANCDYQDPYALAVGAHRSPVGAGWLCKHPDTQPVNHYGDCPGPSEPGYEECWGEQVAFYLTKVGAVVC